MNKEALFVASILSFCLVFVLALDVVPVCGDGELPLEATVTVVEPCEESYGESITGSSGVFLPWYALDVPDNEGAWMFRHGWVSIRLEGLVTNCSDISIWAAKRGWRSPYFKVYASSDGGNWIYVGSGSCTSKEYTRYDFGGSFGDVEYIKVKLGSRWSIMLLDAVWAKGGDS